MANAVRWSQEQLDAHRARRAGPAAPEPVKASKYASTKVEQDGIKFDSKKEARRWDELNRMQQRGLITELKRQQSFVLAPAVHLAGEPRKKPAIRYFADYTYVLDGQLVVEDCKSKPTRKLAAYRLKRHLMKTVHGLDIKET